MSLLVLGGSLGLQSGAPLPWAWHNLWEVACFKKPGFEYLECDNYLGLDNTSSDLISPVSLSVQKTPVLFTMLRSEH